MKSVFSVILVVFMLFATFFAGLSGVPADLASSDNTDAEISLSEENIILLKKIVETETEWLASLQLDNGAIPMTAVENGTATVNPYFADFAALALLDNAEKYSDNVKAYIEWHFSHLNDASADYNNLDATIYDYTVTVSDGKVINEEVIINDGKASYDSTDSYAATFLMVLDKYLEKTGDTDYIISKREDIVRVIEAMLSTLHFGLTYAKPDYEIKYLMDNCEVFEGTLRASSLLEVIFDKNNACRLIETKCEYASRWIRQSIENKMWNSKGGHYESALLKNGSVAFDFAWDEYYPSATAQLFPIIHGLIPADSIRAESLYNSFCNNYDWENFDIPDAFYWGSNVYAAVLMNDIDTAMTYMSNYYTLLDTHSYPLYNADAAKVCMAANLLLDYAVTE